MIIESSLQFVDKKRCHWCTDSELYRAYHDTEWGVPVYDDRLLFEFLILEGMQAGLSWLTVLKKREAFRRAFSNFDPNQIALYDNVSVTLLLNNQDIIRHRLKIESAIKNARACLKLQEKSGSFSDYLWRFVDGKPIQNHWTSASDVPAKTDISDKLSRDLKQQGFSFVGSTICYSLMQAVGLVNDHTTDCFRYQNDETE